MLVKTYFILKSINLTNVKQLYLGIDPIIFTRAYYKNRFHYYYLDYSFLECIHYFEDHDNLVFFDRYSNLFDFFYSSLESNIKKNQKIPYDLGAMVSNQAPKEFNPAVRETFELEEYGWSDLEFNYLKKIVKLCKSNKIDFYAITMPRRTDFSKKYLKDCNDIQNQIESRLSNIYPKKRMIGKINCLDSLGDQRLFINSDHLNAEGQLIYSKIFYNLIKINLTKSLQNN